MSRSYFSVTPLVMSVRMMPGRTSYTPTPSGASRVAKSCVIMPMPALERQYCPRLVLATVVPVSLYLWVADRVAIGLGIWDITDATRTGLELFGLPVEEALFFVVTNLLVAQGLVMFEQVVPRAGAQAASP